MGIKDYNGTTNTEIGKVYDNDGTTNHQIGKVYDNDGTTNSLVYEAGLDVFPNTAYTWGQYDTTTGTKEKNLTVSGNVLSWSITNTVKGISPTVSIDFTPYTKLTFVIDSISGTPLNHNHRVGFYTSRKVYGDATFEGSSKYQKPIGTNAGTYTLDISDVSGSRYIIVQLHCASKATIKLSSIRLE